VEEVERDDGKEMEQEEWRI